MEYYGCVKIDGYGLLFKSNLVKIYYKDNCNEPITIKIEDLIYESNKKENLKKLYK